jgi:hypothetical protein
MQRELGVCSNHRELFKLGREANEAALNSRFPM